MNRGNRDKIERHLKKQTRSAKKELIKFGKASPEEIELKAYGEFRRL